MDDRQIWLRLSQHLTPQVETSLISVIRESYEVAARDFHDPDEGCDAQTYGILVWKFGEFRLRRLIEDGSLPIAHTPDGNAFRFKVGRFRFAMHSVGHSAVQRLDSSFPNNHCAAGRLASANAQAFLDLGPEAYMPCSFVVAHLGNSESGCEQIWIAEPSAEFNGGISGWGFRRQLWRLDTEGAFGVPAVDLPRPSQPGEIDVTLKTQVDTKDPSTG